MGKYLIGQIGEFELKCKQEDHKKNRDARREKERKQQFTKVIQDLNEVKKSTLEN